MLRMMYFIQKHFAGEQSVAVCVLEHAARKGSVSMLDLGAEEGSVPGAQ